MESPQNVIVIVIDALQKDRLGIYGYSDARTPNLDDFAKDAIVFENAFSTINSTDASMTTLMSGLFPKSHGIVGQGGRIPKKEENQVKKAPWLPEILSEEGWTTIGVDWLSRWHRRGFDYYSGFLEDESEDVKHRVRGILESIPLIGRRIRVILGDIYRILIDTNWGEENGSPYDPADACVDEAIKEIRRLEDSKGFFLMVHFWDPHYPLSPPDEYVRKEVEKGFCIGDLDRDDWLDKIIERYGGDTSLNRLHELYDSEVEFVDYEFGRLLDFLEREELLDDSIIVVTADHGESLGEHDIYFDHHGLFDSNIRVPLLIRAPGRRKGRDDRYIQHTEIVPTIMDGLGIDVSADFDGFSVFASEKERDEIYLEESIGQRKVGIRTKSVKYIAELEPGYCGRCGRDHGSTERFFDLVEDTEEKNPIRDLKEREDFQESAREFFSNHKTCDVVGRLANIQSMDGGTEKT